jgi:hypothetical protein
MRRFVDRRVNEHVYDVLALIAIVANPVFVLSWVRTWGLKEPWHNIAAISLIAIISLIVGWARLAVRERREK